MIYNHPIVSMDPLKHNRNNLSRGSVHTLPNPITDLVTSSSNEGKLSTSNTVISSTSSRPLVTQQKLITYLHRKIGKTAINKINEKFLMLFITDF